MKLIKPILFILISGLTNLIFPQTWNSYTSANGLTDNQVRCITSDANGTIWIGTRTKGVVGYNGSSFIAFPKNSSLPLTGGNYYEITAIGAFDGKLYIAVKSSALLGGLYVYDFAANSITWTGTFEIVGGSDIKAFFKAADGQIYGGSGTGFFKRVADNNWSRIGGGWCQSIAQAPDGKIYYTTYDSLFVYDGTSKRGLKSGLFYSVAVDNNNIVYASDNYDTYKYDGTTFTPMNFGGYSKAMAKDANGKIWIASAGAGSYGVKMIDGQVITTYNTGNSPLLSTDMTALYVAPDNKKWIGHYSAGINTVLDQAVVLPITISPQSTNTLVGSLVYFKGNYGVKPYQWSVLPANLGTFETTGDSAGFRANLAGEGTIVVKSSGGADSAVATVTVADTGLIVKLPPTGFNVSKGKYDNRIDLSWVVPGEFDQAFENGVPAGWKTSPPAGQPTAWVESGFLPKGGAKCIKFDVYSPGAPVTDWLISEKIFVTPEKPTLSFWLKTAYAFGNPYSSYLKVSSSGQDTASFTSIVRTFDPQYLADSNLVWKFVTVDLSQYINQNIYLGFRATAEDIIIYLDEMKLTGQPGLTSIGRAVRGYKLYKSESPANVKQPANLILNQLVTSYNDITVTPLTNYFYGVSAVYDSNYETDITPVEFGVGYSQTDSLILNPASSIIPVADGVINQNEYTDAKKIVLTRNGYWADAWLKVAGQKLYIAVDAFNDSTLSTDDYIILAFDKNRDFTYQQNTEGYFRLRKDGAGVEIAFFPYTALGFSQGIVNPAGVTGAAGNTTGHAVYEMIIDLQTSELTLPLNRRIGAFLSAYDVDKDIESSWLERLLAKEYSVTGFASVTFPEPTGTKKEENVPSEFSLSQNYPNPFNPETTISFSVAAAGNVTLKLFDITGTEIGVLFSGYKTPGNYTVKFDGRSLTSGIYFYKLEAGSFSSIKKMILLK